MFTRQDNPHDERRRRLLQEEVRRGDTDGKASARTATSQPARYSHAAELDRQPRLTDLIPSRLSIMALWFFAGALVVAGLETLYYYMPTLAKQTTDGRVAALDLDGEGSLAAYFSSLVLAAAGLSALIVYTLRRHRLDDYRGRYRIWLWAGACWFVMSIDESGSLHEGFKEMVSHLTGQRLLGDGSAWWAIAYGLVLAVVGIYLLLEMRECLSSTAALLCTAACYAVAVATQMKLLLPDRGARGVMLEEGCEMAGNLFLLLSMALHARYVIRDIQGLVAHPDEEVPVKRRQPVKKKESETSADEEPSAAPAAAQVSAAKVEARPQSNTIAPSKFAAQGPSSTVVPSKFDARPVVATKPQVSASTLKPPATPAVTAKPQVKPETKPVAKPAATSSWFSRALGLGKGEAESKPATSSGQKPSATGQNTGQKSSQLRSDPPEDQGARRLSKAERKALKRMQRQEREEED